MFRLFIVLSFMSLALSSQATDWDEFKRDFKRNFADTQEENSRKSIFNRNLEEINKFNAQNRSYTKGINHFSDWNTQEFNRLLSSFDSREEQRPNMADSSQLDPENLPSEVDWRQVPNMVTSVKQQGDCGACWAFATTGMLEGQLVKRTNASRVESLSNQQLIDCDDINKGCSGGNMANALKSISALRGIQREADYPYEDTMGSCRFDESRVVISNEWFGYLERSNEEELKLWVARYGPVSVGLHANDNYLFYKSGIFDDESCSNDGTKLNHAAVVVGYGTDEKFGDYWILKNSFGEEWGQKGYMYMARNKGNQCSIASRATIATFKSESNE